MLQLMWQCNVQQLPQQIAQDSDSRSRLLLLLLLAGSLPMCCQRPLLP